MKKKKLLILCLVLLITTGVFILINIPKRDTEKRKEEETVLCEKDSKAHLFEKKENRKSLEEWKMINSDVVVLLEADEREFVIVQGRDNEEYLNLSIDGNPDIYGVPFLDYRNDFDRDDALVIYGHSTINENLLFSFIKKYYDEDYHSNHQEMVLKDENGESIFRVLGIGRVRSDDPSVFVFEKRVFENTRERVRFAEEIFNLLDKKYSLAVSLSGRFLSLITCDMNDVNYRYVLLLQEEL